MQKLSIHDTLNHISECAIVIVLLFAPLLGASPSVVGQETRKSETDQKSTQCPNTPQKAALNPFPLSNGDERCTQTPALSIFAFGVQPLERSTYAQIGEQVKLLIYILNGANENGSPTETVVKNLRLTTIVDPRIGSTHSISVSLRGDNADVVDSNVVINTPPGSALQVVPRSGQQFDSGTLKVNSNFDVGNNTISFGDLPPGYGEGFSILSLPKIQSDCSGSFIRASLVVPCPEYSLLSFSPHPGSPIGAYSCFFEAHHLPSIQALRSTS